MNTLLTRSVVCLLILHFLAVGSFAKEVVRVGAYKNPPKIFMTPDGRTTGIFPEVLNDIAEKLDWDIEYIHGTWQECLERLQSGEIDLMPDVAVSEKRRALYDFSKEPVLVNWGTAFSRKDISVNSFLDMKNRTIAVMRGSIHTDGLQGIKALTAQFGVPCRFLEVDDYTEVMMLLESQQADVGIVNRLFGTLHWEEYDDIAPTPIIFNPRKLAFATRKGSQRGMLLLEQIDKILVAAKENSNSAYHKVLAYYLGGGGRDWQGQEQRYLTDLKLSPTEYHWIKEHPTIRFSMDPGFAPFEFLSEKGEYQGMAADFLKLVSQKTGLIFELSSHKSWSDSIQAAKDRKTDLLPCIGHSGERQRFFLYSEPYLHFSRVIITRMDATLQNLDELSGRRVAIQADSSHLAFFTENTTIQPLLYKTFEECLLAVSRGEADAAIGNLAVTTHQIQNLSLTNIKIAGYASPKPQSLYFGIRNDWPELRSIINKTLKSIPLQQRNAILAKWLPLPQAAPTTIDLSQEEREWLLMHPRIRVGWDHSWAPIEFAGANGTPQGISIEYLDAIEDLLGIQFDMDTGSKEWQETYEKLKNRELDISSCLAITPERLKHLDFTDSYLSSQVVFFAREDMPYINDISEIQDLRVAVVANYATDEWVSRDFLDINVVRTGSMEEAFTLLSKGKIDLFIGSVLPGNYYLSQHRYRNIKIVGETPFTYKLRMAVRNDWKPFIGILQKALAFLPETDKTSFYRKWVWVKYEHGFDYSLLIKIVLCALIVIAMFIFWNRRLSTEVQHRKEVQAALANSEKALRISYTDLKKLEQLKDDLTHMIVHDMRSPLTTITGVLDLMEFAPGKPDRNTINLARSGVQTATNMAQALLDIGKLETGQMQLNLEEIEIQDAAKSAIHSMEIQASQAGVRLVQSGEHALSKADPDILHRVLVNLIGNALKASPNGAEVEIHTVDEKTQIAVEVRDSGYGIPKEFQERLFDKFTTVDREKHQRTSVGLGLAFCKLAVEAHGGIITVKSEQERGSTFRFSIPKFS